MNSVRSYLERGREIAQRGCFNTRSKQAPRRLFILFRQVSFRNEVTERASRSPFHGSYGEPDSWMPRCSATTLPLRMHGERLVNNTKRPRQTNIKPSVLRATPVRLSLYCRTESCFIARTRRRTLSSTRRSGCCESGSEMIGSRRKADKDQTPAIYLTRWPDVVGQLCRRCLSRRSLAFPSALSVWPFFARHLTQSSSFS